MAVIFGDLWQQFWRVRQLELENAKLRDDLRIKQAIIDDMGEALARKRAFFQRLVEEAEAEGGL
jgi:hypothetical protein